MVDAHVVRIIILDSHLFSNIELITLYTDVIGGWRARPYERTQLPVTPVSGDPVLSLSSTAAHTCGMHIKKITEKFVWGALI